MSQVSFHSNNSVEENDRTIKKNTIPRNYTLTFCFRTKRVDDRACTRRNVTNSNHHNLGIMSAPRKPPRLAESALSSGESTTGDSSQQSQNSQRSQRSVVYLHAATGTRFRCIIQIAFAIVLYPIIILSYSYITFLSLYDISLPVTLPVFVNLKLILSC